MKDTDDAGQPAWSVKTRKPLIGALLLIVAVFIASSLYVDAFAWPFPPPVRTDGTMLSVIRANGQPRLVTLLIGLAARDAAGGRITRLTAPTALSRLETFAPGRHGISPYSAYFLQQMSGHGLDSQRYDPVIPDATIAQLLAANKVVRYPRNVVAIVGAHLNGRVSLFTDPLHTTVYVVSGPLLSEKERP